MNFHTESINRDKLADAFHSSMPWPVVFLALALLNLAAMAVQFKVDAIARSQPYLFMILDPAVSVFALLLGLGRVFVLFYIAYLLGKKLEEKSASVVVCVLLMGLYNILNAGLLLSLPYFAGSLAQSIESLAYAVLILFAGIPIVAAICWASYNYGAGIGKQYSHGTSPKVKQHAGKSTETKYAGFWERFVAHLIDNVFMLFFAVFFSVLAGLLFWLARPLLLPITGYYSAIGTGIMFGILFYLIAPFLYHIYFIGRYGQTFGKSAAKIRVVGRDGNSIGYPKAFLRILLIELFLLIWIPLSLAFVLIAFDREKQGAHDKILGTFVVKTDKTYFEIARAIKVLALAAGAIAVLIVVLVTLSHAFPAPPENGDSKEIKIWFSGKPESLDGAKITFDGKYLGSISSRDCTNFSNECMLPLPHSKVTQQPYHKIFSSNGAECLEWVLDETVLNSDSNYVMLDAADGNQSDKQNCLSGWW